MIKKIQIADLKGKTFISVKKIEYHNGCGEDSIEFISNTGEKFIMCHTQDCCEAVYIEDICGNLDDLINSPLLMSEKNSSYDIPEGINEDSLPYRADQSRWTFYKFATIKGYVTIRWYEGQDSGYYSVDVDILEIK